VVAYVVLGVMGLITLSAGVELVFELFGRR
jgi:hypothetical protein